MEWLGLHFFTDLPTNGHLLLNCSHNPFLVLLAYLVACAAGFGTLDMAERVGHVEAPTARRHWRWLGAGCLAGASGRHISSACWPSRRPSQFTTN